MCGTTGFMTQTEVGRSSVIANRMAAAITHRGPDDSGVWVDEVVSVALAHRRLSILDRSPQGHQSMCLINALDFQ
ncbi:MAG: hypothetical protein Q8O37_16830 [Sulfuricellaceae bacterium]|nr:hypothetical protein [Sulfuricellaceae bacterium]